MMQNKDMPYQQLGKSDLIISQIGFGTMSLGTNQKEFNYLINQAIDKGINYFDTADIYDNGFNETNLGKIIKHKRQGLIIATKVGNQFKTDGNGLEWNPSKKHMLLAVEQSLLRLQTDYIDLYQLHGGTIEDNIDETIEAFELLKQQGKIRHYGISSIRPNVIREYVQRSNIVSVMMQFSLLDRRPAESCLSLLQQNNIGVVARGTVAGGLLAGKAAKKYLDYHEAEVTAAANAIKELKPEFNHLAAKAIQYVLTNKAITSAVVGIRTISQLMEAATAVKAAAINDTEKQILESSIHPNYYTHHR